MSSTGDFEHLPLANGDVAPVRIRVDGRAKRISLKVERVGGVVTLVAPTEAALPAARRFMSKRTRWIAEKRAEAEPLERIDTGASIPVLGRLREIVHAPNAADPVALSGGQLLVGGAKGAVRKATLAFLKAEARKRLDTAARRHAEAVGVPLAGISIRDPKTRWGSCSSDGRMSFSWRLVMAPSSVLDYVAAHEAAHLRHMNHGPDFWALTASLDPAWQAAEAWLKTEGPRLRRYA